MGGILRIHIIKLARRHGGHEYLHIINGNAVRVRALWDRAGRRNELRGPPPSLSLGWGDQGGWRGELCIIAHYLWS